VSTRTTAVFALVLFVSPVAADEPKTAKEFFERGAKRLALGAPDRALPDLTEAIKLDPKFAPAYVARANAHRALGKITEAIADLDEAIKIDPNGAAARAERGVLYAERGDLAKALPDLEAAMAIDPKEPAALRARSVLAMRKGDTDAALKDATTAVTAAPRDPGALHHRANIFVARGEWAEALRDLDDAIANGPNFAEAFHARATLRACCPYGKFRDAVGAFKDAKRARELMGEANGFALEALAAASAELGDYAGAARFQKAAGDDPIYTASAGTAADRLATYEARRPYRLDPPLLGTDAKAHVTRGNQFFVRGQFERAIRDYDAAIKLDPKNAKAFYGRGCAHARVDDTIRALLDLTEAIKLDPKDTSAFVDRAIVRVIRGDWEQAIADFDEAIKLDPKHVNALTHRSMIRSTCPEEKLRDAKKAQADAKAACGLTNWAAGYPLEGYAAAFAEAGDFEAAIKWQVQAMTDKPYTAANGPSMRYRLELYQSKKPLRTGTARKLD
jgi:tetratricopeptide (TPR) repeat protein